MFPLKIDPEATLKEAVEFNRKLLKGIDSLANIEKVEIGLTPKEEVYREDDVVLYHYIPTKKRLLKTPVLIVYALVNRPYMMDVEEGRSLIQNMLDQGLDVYLIDWGYPDMWEQHLTLDDYINGYIDNCVDVLRKRHNMDAINIASVCQGGTFSLCYTALHPEKVKNLVTMVTPVDFHVNDGLLHVWSQPMDVDLMADAFGNIPGEFMNFGYLMLRPWQLMVQKYMGIVDIMENEDSLLSFLRMEKWVFDSPDQAGAAWRQFLKDFYQGNKMIKGELEIGGQKVDLKNIKVPIFNIYGTTDNMVPPSSSKDLAKYVGSDDVTTVAVPGGHIGIYVSKRAQKEVAPKLAAWLKQRA
jgi:polyhydroxyalkanoate synthase